MSVENQEIEQQEEVKQELTPEAIMDMSDEEIEKLDLSVNQEQQQPTVVEDTETDPVQEEFEESENEEVSEELDVAKAFYEKVTAPFKAEKTHVKVDDPEKVIRLMRQGLNYNEKMASLKPSLRIVKSLQQANMLDEGKVNLAIELMQGKPEAIAELLRQHNVNTYDLPSVDEESSYTPSNHIMSEQTFNIKQTIDDIKAMPNGQATIDAIDSWDEKSVDEIIANPNLLVQLHEQKVSGLYDETMKIYQEQQAMGYVPEGTTVIDAYNTIATQLINDPSSKFYKPVQQNTQSDNYFGSTPVYQNREVIGSNRQPQQQVQYQVNPNSRKNQAGIPKNGRTVGSKPNLTVESLLNMSDEDFEQLDRTIKFKV